jgi:CheY-like chemotaxis protein
MTTIAAMHVDDRDCVLDALNKITISGKHLLGLINSVLDMSKIESGKISLNEDEFSILDLVDSLFALFNSQITAKGLELKVNTADIEHKDVIGDEQRLQQIFVNILGNAVKFTPDGGKINLNIREKKANSADRACYEFVVEDNGIGMEKAFVDKIFEPFSRALDSRVYGIEGTGLGMPIAVNVARLMGGDIQVESEPNKGSRFTVTVYLRLNHIQKEELGTNGDKVKRAEIASFKEHSYDGRRILLVEDNELNTEVATEILRVMGFEIDTAVNGKEAVDMAVSHGDGYYDLIFMDIQMPVMNGYEATMAIRSSGVDYLKRVPIIAMTADAFVEDVKKAQQSGMNGHIAKPIDIAKLEKMIGEWL